VDLGLNIASAASMGSVTWHTSNVSVIDHTMSGGPNNLLFGSLTNISCLFCSYVLPAFCFDAAVFSSNKVVSGILIRPLSILNTSRRSALVNLRSSSVHRFNLSSLFRYSNCRRSLNILVNLCSTDSRCSLSF